MNSEPKENSFKLHHLHIRGYDVVMMVCTIYYLFIFLHVHQVLDKIDRGIAIIVITMTITTVLSFFESVLKRRAASDHGFYQFVLVMHGLSQFIGYLAMTYLSWLSLVWTYHRFL